MLLANSKEYIPLKQISKSIRYALGSSYAFDPTNESSNPGLTESVASIVETHMMSLESITPKEPSDLLMFPFLDSPSSVEHLVIASKTLSGNTRLIQCYVFMVNDTVFVTLPHHITYCDGWQQGELQACMAYLIDLAELRPGCNSLIIMLDNHQDSLVDLRAFMYMGFVLLDCSVYKQDPSWTFALYELGTN
ncbi:hypothetical protein J3Q64DRAFT_1837375 [Phycomyces blakesleeanus]|uniref:Uncharacterized protein n=2 Tax=Phycomyces blakesleeanus TaxID=4837 RepID=A0A162PKL1_PHYB8|nr:hypothetical protein PHYBLDRAFT_159674 [Phycomyces blakesleeanus NRRL 1555(-)]OAD69756.1 hypothetical protein PHYBLDRAFT_159674 [Phycomyces blakesleeanus NRRL 1555(-)]|eukprot:XP_018287796.1 hypothetical protein PHYBLDRAFT_159674 [Phycomyces blakesleeanus NRRL 1555(-)]